MNFSISSLFITLCVSLVLIALFNFILTHEKGYRLFRADLLFVLVVITCFRLFLPFELPFTKTIALPSIMNPIMSFLNYEIFHQLKVSHILYCNLVNWSINWCWKICAEYYIGKKTGSENHTKFSLFQSFRIFRLLHLS